MQAEGKTGRLVLLFWIFIILFYLHKKAQQSRMNPSKYVDKCHCGSKITLISNLDTVMEHNGFLKMIFRN